MSISIQIQSKIKKRDLYREMHGTDNVMDIQSEYYVSREFVSYLRVSQRK